MMLSILVVDDNQDAADSTAMLLRATGYQVTIGYSGQEALDAVAANLPHVVLLDLGLPGIDGLEVARCLRARPETAQIRLIALSGFGRDVDRPRTHEIGFDGHLLKPAQLNDILVMLTSA